MSGEDRCAGNVATDNKTETDGGACTKSQTETDAPMQSSSTGSSGDPEVYDMKHKHRGLALIFNQETFFFHLDLKDRVGTNVDRDKMEERLRELNFKVKTYDNLRQMDVITEICDAAESDHTDADCFLLVFLSHGENDHVWTYDGKICIKDITSRFKGNKCPSLVGKPKIFIFQACRGNKADDPVTASSVEVNKNDEVDDFAVQTLPAGADFIMCYSTAEGYISVRDRINGSWYIQDLCKLLKDKGTSLEFTELLTCVNREVSKRSLKGSWKKQMPCFASMLTNKLYFKPKEQQCQTSVKK